MKNKQLQYKLVSEPWNILPIYHKHLLNCCDDECMEDDCAIDTLVLVNLGVILINGVSYKHVSGIPGLVDLDEIKYAINSMVSNPDVSNIMLWFCNAPGGGSTGNKELADYIYEVNMTQKPIISYCDDTMASAAYYYGSQGSAIFCSPSSNIGSIGTYFVLVDESEMNRKAGIEYIEFMGGKFKSAGADYRPPTKDESKMFNDRISNITNIFIDTVKRTRPNITDEDYGLAMVYDGNSAVQHGFADGIIDCFEDLASYLIQNPDTFKS